MFTCHAASWQRVDQRAADTALSLQLDITARALSKDTRDDRLPVSPPQQVLLGPGWRGQVGRVGETVTHVT